MAKGSLTPEQQQKVQDWIQEKWKGDPRCTVCQANQWHIAGDLVSPPLLIRGGMSIGGPTYPQIMNICGNCGHTVYFNSILMGIGEAPTGDDGQKEKAKASGGDNG